MSLPPRANAVWPPLPAHPRWAPDAAAILLLAFLALVFFWPVTLGLGWIPRGGGDLVSFLWPTYSYAADALGSGRIPLWNHSLYSGAPLAADNQSGLFYPLNLLVFLLWPDLPYVALEWLVVAHVWLAGVGMYLLLRLLLSTLTPPPRRVAIPAALVAGLAFMFSDVFVTHIGNLNIIAVSAWLPWAFAFLHLGLTRRSARWCLASGLTLGVAALAGHAQMTLVLALALGIYGLWHIAAQVFPARARQTLSSPLAVDSSALSSPRAGPSHVLRLMFPLVLVFLVSIGVSAISVLPALEMTAYTARARLDYAAAAEYSLPWAGLAGWFSPLTFGRGAANFWGPWPRVEMGYAGLVTLWLAGLAPWRGPASRLPRALAALGLVGLLLALGENAPLHRLFHAIVPGFASLRVPARFILLSNFALAVLAGFGLARLCAIPPRRILGWSAVLALLAVGISVTAWLSVPDHASHTTALLTGLAVAAGLLTLCLAVGLARRRASIPFLFVVLAAVDLVGQGAWIEVDRHDPTVGFQHPLVVDFMRSQPGPVRVDNASSAWSPDAAARYGLEDIGGISNPLALAAYQTYLEAVGSRGSPLYNFLNAQFVLADKGQPPADSRFVPVFAEDPSVDIYLNTVAQPRIRLVYQAEIVSGGEAVFGRLHTPGFDPERSVVLDTDVAGQPPPLPTALPQDAASTLFYTAYAPEAYTVVARTPAPAHLVFSEVWYPGWRAWINGAEVPIYRANLAFRAVFLPAAGEHTVVVRFDPAIWKAGAAITILTLVALALAGLIWQRRSRSHVSLAPSQVAE